MKCPACGAKLPDDAKFCSYCGAEIDAAAAPFSDVRSGPAMYQPKLSAYEKILAVSVLLFTLLCLIAFLAGKPGAGILALMQIAMAAISFFIKKEVIRGAKAWLPFFCSRLMPSCSLRRRPSGLTGMRSSWETGCPPLK